MSEHEAERALVDLARALTQSGVAENQPDRDTVIEARVMYAQQLAAAFIDDFEGPTDAWPSDEAPGHLELYHAIAHIHFTAVLDHALAWASYSCALNEAGPGDQWQVLTNTPPAGWQAGRVGPHAVARCALAMEVAIRGIVLHARIENAKRVDVAKAFCAMDEYLSSEMETDDHIERRLARVGLRAIGRSDLIY